MSTVELKDNLTYLSALEMLGRLVDKGLLFGQGELDELYRCCKRTRELDGTIGYRQEQEIIKVQDHIEAINPGVRERVLERQKTLESGMGLTQG